MSTDTAPPLKLDNITESLALVHGTLGYIPEQSLVIVGLAGSTSAAHLRIDLRPMMSAERDTTHQLVSWLVEDPDHTPEAIAVITLDQERAYTPEQMRSLTVHIEASFALVGVPIAVEHHLRGPHDAEALDQVLQNHPSLSAGSRTPTQEVQHWIETATVSSMTTERLEERIAPLATRTVELILSDDMPDWEAIVEVERQLHAALPPEGSRQRHTVLALKSLICHAQGKGSLATAFLNLNPPTRALNSCWNPEPRARGRWAGSDVPATLRCRSTSLIPVSLVPVWVPCRAECSGARRCWWSQCRCPEFVEGFRPFPFGG